MRRDRHGQSHTAPDGGAPRTMRRGSPAGCGQSRPPPAQSRFIKALSAVVVAASTRTAFLTVQRFQHPLHLHGRPAGTPRGRYAAASTPAVLLKVFGLAPRCPCERIREALIWAGLSPGLLRPPRPSRTLQIRFHNRAYATEAPAPAEPGPLPRWPLRTYQSAEPCRCRADVTLVPCAQRAPVSRPVTKPMRTAACRPPTLVRLQAASPRCNVT